MQKKPGNPIKKSQAQKKDIVFEVSENTLLMDFLVGNLPHKSRDNIKSLLKNKQVWVDNKVVSQFNYRLTAGLKVRISNSRSRVEKKFIEFTILFEDEHLLVIDKSAGLLSIATKNEKRRTAFSMLSDYVKQADPENKIFVVHRLDRETSGLLVFARNEEVKHFLQDKWTDEDIEKGYVAVVEGRIEKQSGTLISYLFEDNVYRVHASQNPKSGQKAVTHFSVIGANADYSLLDLKIDTGRKNQIRVQLQEIGHSIVGDKKYGAVSSPIRRLALHAQKLRFIHPVSGEALSFETKIPPAFQSLIKRRSR